MGGFEENIFFLLILLYRLVDFNIFFGWCCKSEIMIWLCEFFKCLIIFDSKVFSDVLIKEIWFIWSNKIFGFVLVILLKEFFNILVDLKKRDFCMVYFIKLDLWVFLDVFVKIFEIFSDLFICFINIIIVKSRFMFIFVVKLIEIVNKNVVISINELVDLVFKICVNFLCLFIF